MKEKEYEKFRGNSKIEKIRERKEFLREEYSKARKKFDKSYRQAKRRFRRGKFNKIEMAESKNPQEMWRLLKDLSEPKKERELLEFIRNDGTISSDKKEILEKWYKDYAESFGDLKSNPNLAFDDEFF